MWLLDVQQTPPPLALSAGIAAQQAAAASLESAAQLAAAAWHSKQHDLVSTAVGALLSQSFDSLSNGRSHPSQHQQVIQRFPFSFCFAGLRRVAEAPNHPATPECNSLSYWRHPVAPADMRAT